MAHPYRLRPAVLELEDRTTPAALLDIHDDVHAVASLPDTVVTVTGTAELRISGTGDPIAGSTIHLNSPDAWLVFESIKPSAVNSTLLSRVKVNGAAAVLNSNAKIVQYGLGAAVIPQGASYAPLEVFADANFGGASVRLNQYTAYNAASLGAFSQTISSFKLKRGYTMTLAANEDGSGVSKNYVAQDGDLDVPILPAGLDNAARFVRIFPWRWTTKKGIAGNIGDPLDIQWRYNWNINQNSTLDREYVAIRQTQWWPDLNQNWQTRGINHLLGYNEPDRPDQANMTVAQAIAQWPLLQSTGLRLGAPAVSDGGLNWLYDFMNQADAAGLRVDYVPVHYYRSVDPANPTAAATQFYNFLKGIYDTVQRPIWVTEWNNGAGWTSHPDPTFEQQQAAVEAMTAMLESTPFVERYAIYNWVEDARRVQWDDGSLTLAGQTYRDVKSTLAYRQELPDPLTTPSATFSFENDTLDSSGNGHPAMPVGTRTFVPGPVGQALAFDGENDYVQLSPRLGDSANFTFAAWVKWDGGANWQRIIDIGRETDRSLFLTPKASSGVMRFAIRNGSTEQQLNHTAALPVGVWTHVAVTINGSTGKLFVNGEPVGTNTAMTLDPVNLGTHYNYLGKSRFTADPLFAGAMDDVRFSNSALTDAQIAVLALRARDFGFELPATSTFVYNPTGTDWTYSDKSGVAANGSAFTSGNDQAPQGTRVAFLQQNSTITQSLTGLEPGRTYQIAFAASQRQNLSAGQTGQTIAVRIDGNTLASFTPLQSSATYADFTTSFTATSTIHSLSFAGTNPQGGDNTAFLDRVRIVGSVPGIRPSLDLQAGSIRNAGFEENATGTGWLRTGSAAIASSNLRSGTRAMRMSGGTGAAEQTVTGLKPNTAYTLTAWARVSHASINARLGVKNHGATEAWVETNETGFAPIRIGFTTGPNATQATITLAKPESNFAADFDDLSLVESTRSFAGSFRNPGFEDTPLGSGWSNSGSALISTNGPRSGSRSLRMDGATGNSQQTITGLKPNTTYRLSGWARVSSSSISARLGVRNHGNAEAFVSTNNTSYTLLSQVFTTGPASNSAIIYLNKPNGAHAANFDDLELFEENHVINENASGTISYFVDDARVWSINAATSNTSLIPDGNIAIADSGFRRVLQITPAANTTGRTAIHLTLTDASGGTTTRAIAVTVNGRPTAIGQQRIVPMNAPLSMTLTGSDPENLPLTFALTQSPANGSISGSFPNIVYTPANGFFGDDAFQFTVSDGFSTSAAATVAITVVAPPTVAGLSVNDAFPQRSRLDRIAITFQNPVPAAFLNGPGAITLTRTSGGPATVVQTGATGANGLIQVAQNGPNNLILTFSNASGAATSAGIEYGSLTDGYWRLSIPAANYQSPLNAPAFRRLFGDADNNGNVDANDMASLGNAFGITSPDNPFDYNRDGIVDANDFAQFGNRFGRSL